MSNRLVRSGVPLVYQLGEILRRRIVDRQLKANDAFPTEDQICKEFNVSRTTVRLALAKLVNEGFIRRQQGVGTFVNPIGLAKVGELQPLPRDMSDVKSTTSIVEAAGGKISTKVLSFDIERPSARMAERLDIGEDEFVVHFERVRFADGVPLVLEKIWIPEKLCPGLTEPEVHGSVYRVLSERFGLNLQAAHQALRAHTADATIGKHLGVIRGTAVMRVEGVTYLESGDAAKIEESYFRSDMMEFVIELGSYSTYARMLGVDASASKLSRQDERQ